MDDLAWNKKILGYDSISFKSPTECTREHKTVGLVDRAGSFPTRGIELVVYNCAAESLFQNIRVGKDLLRPIASTEDFAAVSKGIASTVSQRYTDVERVVYWHHVAEKNMRLVGRAGKAK